jgi:uncharacterized protein
MGIRYILLGIGLWLLFTSIRRFVRKRKQQRRESKSAQSVNMVACSHCGVHLPQDEAIHKGKSYYCCSEHSRLGETKDNNIDG